MKKKKSLVIGLAAVLAVVIAVAVVVAVGQNRVKPFSVKDAHYQQMMEEFAINCMSDPVNSPKQARKAAESIWIENFGEENLKNQKPYAVFYDEAEKVWLITGSEPSPSLGGVAKVLIREDGMILAVWHEE